MDLVVLKAKTVRFLRKWKTVLLVVGIIITASGALVYTFVPSESINIFSEAFQRTNFYYNSSEWIQLGYMEVGDNVSIRFVPADQNYTNWTYVVNISFWAGPVENKHYVTSLTNWTVNETVPWEATFSAPSSDFYQMELQAYILIPQGDNVSVENRNFSFAYRVIRRDIHHLNEKIGIPLLGSGVIILTFGIMGYLLKEEKRSREEILLEIYKEMP